MKNLIIDKKDHIALLTINRPEVRNALDGETYGELSEAIEDIKNDRSIRVLVITGADKSFCSGLDLKFAASMNNLTTLEFRTLLKKLQDMFSFEMLNIPVISAVNGYALGNGCDIAIASDIIIASENAIFGMVYTNLGMIPDLGGTFRLPRLIGSAMAKELILTGEKIDAKRALEIGMVSRVVPHDKLMDEAMGLAEKLAKRAPIAMAMAKKAINNGLDNNLQASLEFESYMQNVCIKSKDVTEAVIAFMEKREPNFTGE